MRLVFLGGILSTPNKKFLLENSIGPVQNAADVLQIGFVQGFDSNYPGEVFVLNLPYLGSFPRRFKKIYIPGENGAFFSKARLVGVGFFNITVIKAVARFFSSFFGLLKYGFVADHLVVYAAHLPFVCSAILFSFVRRRVQLAIIIPDLPEFMSDKTGLMGWLKKIQASVFYFLVKRFDKFVVLTEAMADRIGVKRDAFTVVEGIALPRMLAQRKGERRYILYTGTLELRYGIKLLIEAFNVANPENCELWICGDGDGRDFVTQSSAENSKIVFLGQLERERVLRLQEEALVLINPRQPIGEFTKYSFPSKVIEYMSSARPVLMYDLPGVPREYSPYYLRPRDLTVESLAEVILYVSEASDSFLDDFGFEAKKFIDEHKSADAQVSRVVQFFFGDKND